MPESSADGRPAPGRYLGMWLGAIGLAVDQRRVLMLEPGTDLEPPDGRPGACASLRIVGRRVPAFAPNSDLRPRAAPASDHRICVVLQAEPEPYGLLVARVQPIAMQSLRIQPVPACMAAPDGAVTGLAVDPDGGWVSSVLDPDRLLGRLSVPADRGESIVASGI